MPAIQAECTARILRRSTAVSADDQVDAASDEPETQDQAAHDDHLVGTGVHPGPNLARTPGSGRAGNRRRSPWPGRTTKPGRRTQPARGSSPSWRARPRPWWPRPRGSGPRAAGWCQAHREPWGHGVHLRLPLRRLLRRLRPPHPAAVPDRDRDQAAPTAIFTASWARDGAVRLGGSLPGPSTVTVTTIASDTSHPSTRRCPFAPALGGHHHGECR